MTPSNTVDWEANNLDCSYVQEYIKNTAYTRSTKDIEGINIPEEFKYNFQNGLNQTD